MGSMTSASVALQSAKVVAAIRAAAGPSRSIAFISGKFNIVHPGHLRLFKFAAENADFLVVGVAPDNGARDTLPAELRLEAVRAVNLVDYAFLLDAPAEEMVAALRPEVVVKGKEFQDKLNLEQKAVDAYGGRLLFSAGEVAFSSLNLIRNEFTNIEFSTIHKPRDYPARHGFQISDLRWTLDQIVGVRALVIGDLIVDKYVTCDPLGMSQEDPTIVVTPIEATSFLGAAGIVAAHARGLQADVHFLTVCGDDDTAEFARSALADYGVESDLMIDRTRPTTIKTRYRARGKTLLRVNELRQHAIDSDLVRKMAARADELIANIDLLILSDFNYGCLPQPLVDILIEKARDRGVLIAADSQASSQHADISRFRNVDLVTPTEREARLALQDFSSGLVGVAERLKERSAARNVAITLGGEGLLFYAPFTDNEYAMDRLPAFNTAPKDVAGAGDSFLCAASLALCAQHDPWKAVYLGALTAACQVGRVGNRPLTREELLVEINYAER
jgi:rfaE bifunctional protein kinase chain/domain